jgi:hypothetical protein
MNGLDQEVDAFEAGLDAMESSDEFEWLGEGEEEWTGETDGEAVFDEVEEMELAAELLGIQNEEELEEFLGKLIKRAGAGIKKFANSSVGKALGGVLKTVASKALPIAGAALGNLVLPGVGGMIGSKLASAGGKMFGLELEGMSPQDQEFEVARRFVRLSGAAARQAARMPIYGSPVDLAKDAVLGAAQIYAPGLVRGGGHGGYGGRYGGRGSSRRSARRFRQRGGYPSSQSYGYGGYGGNGNGNGNGAGYGYVDTSGYGFDGGSGGGGYGGWGGQYEAEAGPAGALQRAAAPGVPGRPGARAASGTWVRRGRVIVVRGA